MLIFYLNNKNRGPLLPILWKNCTRTATFGYLLKGAQYIV